MGFTRSEGWLFPADGAVAPEVVEEVFVDLEVGEDDGALDISDLTAKEIEEKVESGELNADEVYAAELAGKNRKGVLEAYAPAE